MKKWDEIDKSLLTEEERLIKHGFWEGFEHLLIDEIRTGDKTEFIFMVPNTNGHKLKVVKLERLYYFSVYYCYNYGRYGSVQPYEELLCAGECDVHIKSHYLSAINSREIQKDLQYLLDTVCISDTASDTDFFIRIPYVREPIADAMTGEQRTESIISTFNMYIKIVREIKKLERLYNNAIKYEIKSPILSLLRELNT